MISLPDEHLNIGTPENVTFGYEVAGIGSRFLAALIDTAFIILAQALVYGTLILLLVNLPFIGADQLVESPRAVAWIAAAFSLLAFAMLWGYYIFFEMYWNGQSPGKRWVKLRVMCTNGTPITLTESIIRNLVRFIDFLPFSYGIGVITMFINEQSRRLGDLAAGTLVVHDRAAVTLESLTTTIQPPSRRHDPVDGAHSEWPVERLTSQEIQMAEDFLRRRLEIYNSHELAHQILKLLYKRFDKPVPQLGNWDTVNLIAKIVHQHRAKR